MEPEILLGGNTHLSLEPQRELRGKRADIGVEISRPLVVNALAHDVVLNTGIANSAGDTRKHRCVESHREKSGAAVRRCGAAKKRNEQTSASRVLIADDSDYAILSKNSRNA